MSCNALSPSPVLTFIDFNFAQVPFGLLRWSMIIAPYWHIQRVKLLLQIQATDRNIFHVDHLQCSPKPFWCMNRTHISQDTHYYPNIIWFLLAHHPLNSFHPSSPSFYLPAFVNRLSTTWEELLVMVRAVFFCFDVVLFYLSGRPFKAFTNPSWINTSLTCSRHKPKFITPLNLPLLNLLTLVYFDESVSILYLCQPLHSASTS